MSDRRKHLILMGAIVAALVGVVLLVVPGSPIHRKPTLGLDLQGGLEVVLKAVPPKGHVLTSADMDRSISIMQSRINKLGVTEPEIRKQGANQIVIQLAGVHDPATAARLIGKTAQLQLFDFEADLTGPSKNLNGNPVATPTLYGLLTQVQKQAAKGTPAGVLPVPERQGHRQDDEEGDGQGQERQEARACSSRRRRPSSSTRSSRGRPTR